MKFRGIRQFYGICLTSIWLVFLGSFFTLGSTVVGAAKCTLTEYHGLTAVLINPTNPVSGELDATGCDIGIYYGFGTTGSVTNATIHGADSIGVVNNGGIVDITNSQIYDIGHLPSQAYPAPRGIAISFIYGSQAKGKISGNQIWNYKQVGIRVNGTGSFAEITNNVVTGLGPVSEWPLNAVQIGFGASARISGNHISKNQYTQSDTTASGIVLPGGGGYRADFGYTTDVLIEGNTLTDNDVGVWLTNIKSCVDLNSPLTCLPPDTATNNKVVNNTIVSNTISNVYQTGIEVFLGNNDKLINNNISGIGYTPSVTPSIYYNSAIELGYPGTPAYAVNEKIHANN